MGSIRLDPEMQEKVRHAAAVKGVTLSEIYRRALTEYYEREIADKEDNLYDTPFYNSIFGAIEGPHDLSARSGEIYKEAMDEKYRGHAD